MKRGLAAAGWGGTIHPVHLGIWAILGVVVWVSWAALCAVILYNPRGDLIAGFYWRFLRVYTRVVHRLRARGMEELRRQREPGALIVVSNHTAGVDPLLIQATCHFEPRWVMAEDMRFAPAEPVWEYGRIIFVDRKKGDLAATREAIRHVKGGGVLGIFPEGRIERPARVLQPFEPGIGLLIKRSNAPVLPVLIEGTPAVESAWASLYTPSRSRVTYKELIHYEAMGLSADEIVEDLQRRYEEWTGWPVKARGE